MRTRLPAPKGSYHRIAAEAWPELDALYRAFASGRNGALMRPERWWRTQIMTTWRGEPREAVIWSDASGEPRGYAVYRSSYQPGSGGHGETTLRVQDWIALDAGAYSALLTYLLSHDLATRIVMLAGTDEPFSAAFEEPTHFEEPHRAWPGIMLRLVDLERAVAARPALPQASGKAVLIELTDKSAPWNEGTWRIEAAEGAMRAERTDAAPELEMDVRALAAIYNGFTKPADAVRVGQARALSQGAVAAATDIFAVSHAPYTPDDF
jgi:predicted acetyltransferase